MGNLWTLMGGGPSQGLEQKFVYAIYCKALLRLMVKPFPSFIPYGICQVQATSPHTPHVTNLSPAAHRFETTWAFVEFCSRLRPRLPAQARRMQ